MALKMSLNLLWSEARLRSEHSFSDVDLPLRYQQTQDLGTPDRQRNPCATQVFCAALVNIPIRTTLGTSHTCVQSGTLSFRTISPRSVCSSNQVGGPRGADGRELEPGPQDDRT